MEVSHVILVVVLAVVESVAMKTITGISELIESVKKAAEKLRLKSFDAYSDKELSKSIILDSVPLQNGWMHIKVSTALDMITVMIHTVRRFSTREIDDDCGVLLLAEVFPIAALCVPRNWLPIIAYLAIYWIVYWIVSKIVKRPVNTDQEYLSLISNLSCVQNWHESEVIQIEEYAYTFNNWITIENCMRSLFAKAKTAKAVCVSALIVACVIALAI